MKQWLLFSILPKLVLFALLYAAIGNPPVSWWRAIAVGIVVGMFQEHTKWWESRSS